MEKKKTGLCWLWLSLFVIIADQVSKYLIVQNIEYNSIFYLLPFLNFTLEHNTGAAYGFLGKYGQLASLFFIATALIISIVLGVWLHRLPRQSRWLGISLGLILGGAIGNLIDRVCYGYVIDFVHFHINTWSFAIFNFADSAITVGAIMLIIDIFRGKKNENSTR
jgi:signal peptidase II